jgi:hypothetical protein
MWAATFWQWNNDRQVKKVPFSRRPAGRRPNGNIQPFRRSKYFRNAFAIIATDNKLIIRVFEGDRRTPTEQTAVICVLLSTQPGGFMKSVTLIFSAALCLAAFPAFAGSPVVPSDSIMLAQDVTISPNGIGIGERGRDRDRVRDHDRYDRDHDRRVLRFGDRDHDRGGCKTVTVQERGETRTTRRCD